jgi:polysaccharide biosynthesis protein PslH
MRPLRLLFVTPYVPSLLRVRSYGFVKFLAARGHRVTLLAAATSDEEARGRHDVEACCEAVTVVRVSLARSLWNCALGLRGDVPLQARFSYAPALEQALRHHLGGREPFDLVHVEHLRAALLGLGLRGVPRVFDAVDCISSLFARAAQQASSPASRWLARLDLGRTRRFEARLPRQFDASLVTSESDRAALRQLAWDGGAPHDAEGDPAVVPNGVDLAYFTPGEVPRSAREIVFVGRMSYHANVAAAVHLVEEVMPRVWQAHPGARLTIVGADPAARVRALARRDDRVMVTGRVADVRPYLQRAAVSACPLLYAAGIQNKVLEAMACATPVVASPSACEALAVRAGTHLLRAEGAEAFARELSRTLADADLRSRLGEAGRAYVKAEHDWNSVVRRLEELYQSALERYRTRSRSGNEDSWAEK